MRTKFKYRMFLAIVVAALIAVPIFLHGKQGRAQRSGNRPERGAGAGYAVSGNAIRFNMDERPVKVIVLGGSISAYRDQPYARNLHEWCDKAEFRNISKVGFGAQQLYSRFRDSILRDGPLRAGRDGHEWWLIWNGGLNSVGVPSRTNEYARRLFLDAHERGIRVVGLSLSPWGSSGDPRFRSTRGLETFADTKAVVDFVMGRGTPSGRREGFNATAFEARELADIRVDLFDSRLRNRDAVLLAEDLVRRNLLADAPYRRQHGTDLAFVARDVQTLREMPRWFLKPEYLGFDSIHPNREGHRVIAETACRSLPTSWGCHCPQ